MQHLRSSFSRASYKPRHTDTWRTHALTHLHQHTHTHTPADVQGHAMAYSSSLVYLESCRQTKQAASHNPDTEDITHASSFESLWRTIVIQLKGHAYRRDHELSRSHTRIRYVAHMHMQTTHVAQTHYTKRALPQGEENQRTNSTIK